VCALGPAGARLHAVTANSKTQAASKHRISFFPSRAQPLHCLASEASFGGRACRARKRFRASAQNCIVAPGAKATANASPVTALLSRAGRQMSQQDGLCPRAQSFKDMDWLARQAPPTNG